MNQKYFTAVTPQTFGEGDPQPAGYVLRWEKIWGSQDLPREDAKPGRWCPAPGDAIGLGDVWIPMPPPPGAWQGSTGPLDPAQAWGAEALLRVTRERDAARREIAELRAAQMADKAPEVGRTEPWPGSIW
jgi:hypothetical protein